MTKRGGTQLNRKHLKTHINSNTNTNKIQEVSCKHLCFCVRVFQNTKQHFARVKYLTGHEAALTRRSDVEVFATFLQQKWQFPRWVGEGNIMASGPGGSPDGHDAELDELLDSKSRH